MFKCFKCKDIIFCCSSCCPHFGWFALKRCWEWVVSASLRAVLQAAPIAGWQSGAHCGERGPPVRRRKHSWHLSAVELGHWHLGGVSHTGCWQRLSRLLDAWPQYWHNTHGWLEWGKDNHSDQAWWGTGAWFHTQTWYKVRYANIISLLQAKLSSWSRSCAIEDPDTDTVVITGGYYTMTTVSVYGLQGWLEDLSSLNIGRREHACTSFVSNGYRVRNI